MDNIEDFIDEPYIKSDVIKLKNLMIVLMMLITFLFFLQAYFQKSEDMIICNNTMLSNCADMLGMPIYDPNIGAIISNYRNDSNYTLYKIGRNMSELTIEIEK